MANAPVVIKFRLLVTVSNVLNDTHEILHEEFVGENIWSMKPVRRKTTWLFNKSNNSICDSRYVVTASYFGTFLGGDNPQHIYGALRGANRKVISRHGWFKHRTSRKHVTAVDSEAGLGSWVHVHDLSSQNKRLIVPLFGDDWLEPAGVRVPLKHCG